jgi:hypothetical protein
MLDTVKEDVTAEDDVAVDAPKDCLSLSGVTIKGWRMFGRTLFAAMAGLTT